MLRGGFEWIEARSQRAQKRKWTNNVGWLKSHRMTEIERVLRQ